MARRAAEQAPFAKRLPVFSSRDYGEPGELRVLGNASLERFEPKKRLNTTNALCDDSEIVVGICASFMQIRG
jgi:hypothetical protein